jgi:carotenoid 1,2-hydratase
VSDDGRSAIVVIALLGNPFSPAYAHARERGPADALAYSAMNVAVYGRGRGTSAWSLRERRVFESERGATHLTIGSSSMRWEGDRLIVQLDERTTPFGRPVRGTITLDPETRPGVEMAIDEQGLHRWWPIAPLARIDVDLKVPGVRFRGHGYHDANAGDVSLETTFDSWSWSRARTSRGALMMYDVKSASGAESSLSFLVTPGGDLLDLELPRRTRVRTSAWGLERHVRSDERGPARIVRTLEEGPFYARALVESRFEGQSVLAMHETLAAHRLRRRWVRFLTGYRMGTEA